MNSLRGWTTTITEIAVPLHGLAIISTLFRLWYRSSVTSLWWDDAWAVVALFADTITLVSVILQQSTSGSANHARLSTISRWIGSLAPPTTLWSTRLSILTSMVRISKPDIVLQRVAVCIGLTFGASWACMIAQRIRTCISLSCAITAAIAISQTTADCLADILLTMLPIVFLRGVKLCRKSKILIFLTFSASMIITVVTIAHAIFLFRPITPETIILAQVKNALSVVVCNLLAIVTFVYRILHEGQRSLEGPDVAKSCMELTTIELSQVVYSQETSQDASFLTCSSGMTRSSTWSFKHSDPLATKLPGVVPDTLGVETIHQDGIVQEER